AGVLARARSRPRRYYGMQLAHLGVAVSILGITLVSGYQTEQNVRMNVGGQATLAGHHFRFGGVRPTEGPNYLGARADIDLLDRERPVRTLHPEKRVYRTSTNAMTEAAIDARPFRNLYVSLGEPLEGGAWTVRLQYQPFVNWIWGGAVLMALG